MLQFKLSNKDYTMPEMVDLSYGMFLKLLKCETDYSRLELLLNADLSVLDGSEKTERQMSGTIALLNNLLEDIHDWLNNRPTAEESKTITVMGKVIKFNKDLGKLPYWPLTKVKDIVKQMGDEPFNQHEHYSSLVANYIYPKFNKYNEYEAEQFAEDVVNELPFKDVIALGDFFLYTQRHLWMQKRDYSSLKQARKKKMLELIGF